MAKIDILAKGGTAINPVRVHEFKTPGVTGEKYYLPEGKRIEGNPQQTLWNHYTDASRKFSAGIWQSEVGKWHIAYTEEEYCRILEGTSIISDAQGAEVTVVAGESFVILRGFSGTWEVVELTRKVYVIYEPEA